MRGEAKGFLAVMIAVTAISGCTAGDGKLSPEAQLRTDALVYLRSTNEYELCRSLAPKLRREIFGSRAECLRSTADLYSEDEDDNGDEYEYDASLGAVTIDGRNGRAAVRIREEGTSTTGHIRLTRAGAHWTITDFEDDLVRAYVRASYRYKRIVDALPAAKTSKPVACLDRRFARLSRKQARRYLFGFWNLTTDAAWRRLYTSLDACVSTRGGISPTRAVFEFDEREYLGDQKYDAQIAACVTTRMRSIPERRILEYLSTPYDDGADIIDVETEALDACKSEVS